MEDPPPGWEIIIWTEKELVHFSWSNPHSKEVYEKAKSFPEKTDVLRYEILYQYGGIYVDTDVICLKSFHDLIANEVTFFACLETNDLYMEIFVCALCNAIIGSRKNHPVIKYCIDQLKSEDESTMNLLFRTGPLLLTRGCEKRLKETSDKILILP